MRRDDASSTPSDARILLVEDDTILALEIERVAAELGHTTFVSVSGEDAIAQARRLRPDLVIMDVKLKGELDGIAAAEAIKRELGCEVVFMTAYGDPDLARDMRRLAGPDVLGKPISEAILRLTLKQKLG
jgi:CheY-like chemotaxis protein